MSVLIKGMEMPASCAKCFMCQSDCMGCKGTQNFIILKKGQNKPSWCPLVEVPPHGRLIDADKLYLRFMNLSSDEWNKKAVCTWADGFIESALEVEDAPTIIEAEGEENG